MRKITIIVYGVLISFYSMSCLSQKRIQSAITKSNETVARPTKTYITGSSAGDNKLKAFQKKMEELESELALYESFLNSNMKYDVKQNNFTFIGDGALLKIGSKFIENNYDLPLTEIKNGKKYAPEYGFKYEENRYQEFINKYNNLKENSHAQAIQYKQSRADNEYVNSDDYASSQYVKSQLFKEKPEDPILSEMHRNNKGKIVFNTTMIDKNNPKGDFKGTFNVTNRLYARAFFNKSFTNTTMYNSKNDSIRYAENNVAFPYTIIYIDGMKQEYKYDNVTISDNAQLKNNTRQIWLYPNVSDGLTDIKWIKSVDNLTPGNHKVRLEYFIYDPTEKEEYIAKIAEGEFTLVKNANDKLKIGKSWANFKPLHSNTTLENAILEVAKKTSKIEDNLQPNAVKIMDTNWTVIKNKITGAILHRIMVVQIKCSNQDGYCYTYPREVKQDYIGGNFSTTITLVTHTNKNIGFDGYIDCN